MKFRTFGNKSNKHVLLLHGGGLSWWSLQEHIDGLKDDYYVIAATIDGHGDDADNTFITIENCADKITEYIKTELSGKLFAICGLSIGAQIAIEVLSKDKGIAQKAVIESGLVIPMKTVASMARPMYAASYFLIKQKWFSKYQAKALYVPENMFDSYYEDSCKMSKESLINMTVSNSLYAMPDSLKDSKADTLIIVGSKELSVMKKSGQLLNETIPNTKLKVIDKFGHGQFSLQTPKKYIALLKEFFK